jgi:choline dehydrogenase-like flavoprotein
VQISATELTPGTQLEADVAIVGAGPAGIVLALELERAGIRVVLVESGGNSFNPGAQRLGETTGEDPVHTPMSLTTRRQIGGASNLWAGRCVPFDAIDFEQRPIVGGARWPVGYEELSRYFERTCAWCMCGEAVFDAREIPSLAERSLIPGWPGGELCASALERWSLPTNFGRLYGERLRASRLVTLVSQLTCTEIVCAQEGTRVEYLVAHTLAGMRVTVKAGRYVLACGGLEATRLLFASNRVHRDGIGNHSGHLGRWYMAHVETRVATARFATPPEQTIYDYERDGDRVYVRRRFTFAPEFLRAHDLANTAMWLTNPEIADATHANGTLSLIYLMLASPLGRYLVSEGIRQSQIKTTRRVSNRQHLSNIARQPLPAMRFALDFGYRRFLKSGRKIPGFFVPNAANAYPLVYHGEHLPHYESHVAPARERDALGVPRLRTHLHFADRDIDSAIAAHAHFDRYLRTHRLGRLEYLYEDLPSAIRARLYGGYHQAGTTRMSASPADGVLDADLAVHGFEDLYVASGSAFVTSGQANTTFMILAFALRLADRLIALERHVPRLAERASEGLAERPRGRLSSATG